MFCSNFAGADCPLSFCYLLRLSCSLCSSPSSLYMLILCGVSSPPTTSLFSYALSFLSCSTSKLFWSSWFSSLLRSIFFLGLYGYLFSWVTCLICSKWSFSSKLLLLSEDPWWAELSVNWTNWYGGVDWSGAAPILWPCLRFVGPNWLKLAWLLCFRSCCCSWSCYRLSYCWLSSL